MINNEQSLFPTHLGYKASKLQKTTRKMFDWDFVFVVFFYFLMLYYSECSKIHIFLKVRFFFISSTHLWEALGIIQMFFHKRDTNLGVNAGIYLRFPKNLIDQLFFFFRYDQVESNSILKNIYIRIRIIINELIWKLHFVFTLVTFVWN